ncbi:MAG TPA: hypothetical protein VNO50_08430 [Pyrinomonadaceae bacterium]|nr:hypothetical protein [Pyrinomonadaceae bacterium]
MPKRFLVTTVLAAALLFSQVGAFLVAALCPHLQSGTTSCETQLSEPTMSHEDMGHTGHMEMEQGQASQPEAEVASLAQPISSCSHCAVHSRTIPKAVSLRQAEAAKRSVDLNIPLQVSRVAPIAASPVAVLTTRAHGPPGDPIPRHILINIFRI